MTPKVRRAFANLVERHPDLAWFYTQLPAIADDDASRCGVHGLRDPADPAITRRILTLMLTDES